MSHQRKQGANVFAKNNNNQTPKAKVQQVHDYFKSHNATKYAKIIVEKQKTLIALLEKAESN